MKAKQYLTLYLMLTPIICPAAFQTPSMWHDYDPRNGFNGSQEPITEWFSHTISALEQGDIDAFTAQLEEGRTLMADIANAVNPDEYKPLLHYAIERNFPLAIELLLAEKADPNMQIDEDDTALIYLAKQHDSPEIAQQLIENGADVNAINKEDWTALMEAISNNHTALAHFLADRGAQLSSYEERKVQQLAKDGLLSEIKQRIKQHKQRLSEELQQSHRVPQAVGRLISEF